MASNMASGVDRTLIVGPDGRTLFPTPRGVVVAHAPARVNPKNRPFVRSSGLVDVARTRSQCPDRRGKSRRDRSPDGPSALKRFPGRRGRKSPNSGQLSSAAEVSRSFCNPRHRFPFARRLTLDSAGIFPVET